MIPVNLTAVELLDFVDDPCFTGSTDEIELEIDKGTPAPSARALIEDILARSRDVGPWRVDLLEQSETDVAVIEPNLETVGTSYGKALVESIVGHSIDAAPLPVGWYGVADGFSASDWVGSPASDAAAMYRATIAYTGNNHPLIRCIPRIPKRLISRPGEDPGGPEPSVGGGGAS